MRRRWLLPLLPLAAGVAMLPFDTVAENWAHGLRLSGDLRRELEAAQQFGDLLSLLVVGLVIWLLDPRRRRALLVGAGAIAATAILCTTIKMMVGRPRPKFRSPAFLWPWGSFDLGGTIGAEHAWEFWRAKSADLWSMPSSHTAFAAALATVLARLYPRLTGLVAVLTVVVGLARVIFAAHYPSDVLIGAAVGWWSAMLGMLAVERFGGVAIVPRGGEQSMVPA